MKLGQYTDNIYTEHYKLRSYLKNDKYYSNFYYKNELLLSFRTHVNKEKIYFAYHNSLYKHLAIKAYMIFVNKCEKNHFWKKAYSPYSNKIEIVSWHNFNIKMNILNN